MYLYTHTHSHTIMWDEFCCHGRTLLLEAKVGAIFMCIFVSVCGVLSVFLAFLSLRSLTLLAPPGC